MPTLSICNVRAASCLTCVLVLAAANIAPAGVHLSDISPSTGVADQFLGFSAAFIPDLDGDGNDELLVGVPGDQRGGSDAGAVFLWLGGQEVTEEPHRVWEGVPGEFLGYCVAHVGDLDDDGAADFALGAPRYSQTGERRGRILVFYGAANLPASGLAEDRADDELVGLVGGEQFGFSVAAAGDHDGDGNDDLIAGAPWSNAGGLFSGAAYVVYGASSGVSTDLLDATAMAGRSAGANFGWSVTGAGNFLGGNPESVAVGAPRYSWPGTNAGAVFVFEGGLGGAMPDTTVEMVLLVDVTNRFGAHYGWTVRGRGRFDSDGFDDLAVGSPGANDGLGIRGRVEIHYGDGGPDALADRWLRGVAANDSLGYGLDWVRDPGASRTDLVAGAPFANAPDDQGLDTGDGGRAYRWAAGDASGSAGGVEQLPVTPMMPGLAGGDHYGFWAAAGGDFDGDGLADLAIAAPTGNIGNNAVAGYIHLIDTSLLTVPNLLADWSADRREDGSAVLRFAAGRPAASVTAVDLFRRDRRGRALLWSGPARSGAASAGVLALEHGSFVFVDATAEPAAAYDLTFRFADGTSGTVGSLAGPAASVAARGLEMADPWPNPANPLVSVSFRAPAGSAATGRVFDTRGRLVRTLELPPADGAWQRFNWDGTTAAGGAAASGTYFLRLETGSESRTRAVTLVR